MAYYWVNQGKTYNEENKGGYLWAPLKNTLNHTVFHWETMNDLKTNDIVFNYCKGYLVGYCIVTSLPYEIEIPPEFKRTNDWNIDGRMVNAEYHKFEKSISLKELYENIKTLLPLKHSPITNNPIKANQGYLYKISDDCGFKIQETTNTTIAHDATSTNTAEIPTTDIPDTTSRKGLITSRIGQGAYRRKVLQRWQNKCAVTGCSITEILIASHIKPWRESNDQERLDVNNGILLSPKYDALFDRHLISFEDTGEIIISKKLTLDSLGDLKLSGKERINNLTEANKTYLAHHRKKVE